MHYLKTTATLTGAWKCSWSKLTLFLLGLVCTRKFCKLNYASQECEKNKYIIPTRERAAPTKSPRCGCSTTKGGIYFFLSHIVNFVWVAPVNYTNKRNLLAWTTAFPQSAASQWYLCVSTFLLLERRDLTPNSLKSLPGIEESYKKDQAIQYLKGGQDAMWWGESSGCSEPIQQHIPAWHTPSWLQSEFLVRDDPQPDMQPFLGFWHDLLPTSMAGSCFTWGFIAGSQGFWSCLMWAQQAVGWVPKVVVTPHSGDVMAESASFN